MTRGRLQVLAEGQHIDAVLTHVAHDRHDLVVGLAQADHQPGLGWNRRKARLERLKQSKRMQIIRSRTDLLVQTRHGFKIVVHHVRRRCCKDFERALEPAAEVGN